MNDPDLLKTDQTNTGIVAAFGIDLYGDRLKLSPEIRYIIGVNNRNLKTFEVSLEHSAELTKHIPQDRCKISESGIHRSEDLMYLKEHGFQGFLIGERFMREADPGQALAQFIKL